MSAESLRERRIRLMPGDYSEPSAWPAGLGFGVVWFPGSTPAPRASNCAYCQTLTTTPTCFTCGAPRREP